MSGTQTQLELGLDCPPPQTPPPARTRRRKEPAAAPPPVAPQQPIEFDRQSRRKLITDAPLRTWQIREGKVNRRISADVQKSVLRAIDDHAVECWGISQVMRFTSLPKRKAWRAIKALREQGLIVVAKRIGRHQGVNVTHDRFSIAWEELAIVAGRFRLAADDISARAQVGTRGPIRPCPPGLLAVPTGDSARAHLVIRPCPPGHANPKGTPIENPKGTRGADDDDDDVKRCITAKARRIRDSIFGGPKRMPSLLRKRIWTVATHWQTGRLRPEVAEDLLDELARMRDCRGGVRDPRSALYRLVLRRGLDLDQLVVATPPEVASPPEPAEPMRRPMQ